MTKTKNSAYLLFKFKSRGGSRTVKTVKNVQQELTVKSLEHSVSKSRNTTIEGVMGM